MHPLVITLLLFISQNVQIVSVTNKSLKHYPF